MKCITLVLFLCDTTDKSIIFFLQIAFLTVGKDGDTVTFPLASVIGCV